MAFSYVTPENVFKLYKDSEKYMRPLFEPLTEYERLARNRPHPGIDKNYPKVTDGTLASIITKTPRRIIQQIPEAKVVSEDDKDWLPVMAQWLLDNEILPNCNTQYELIQKCWSIVEKGLTYGSQFSLTAFMYVNGKFKVDFTLPYVKDGFFEVGKISGSDSNAFAIRAWYQEADLDSIIAKHTDLKSKGIDDGWNTEVLDEIKDQMSQKDDLSTTPDEKDKQNRRGGVELVHVLQNGVGAKFYTIHMKTKQIARTKVNKDPRGVMPVNHFYAGIDMSNPLGRGYAEQVGAMQNLLDAEVQMYQYNRALMLNPPMTKIGNWNKAQAKLAPNVLVDLGSDPNARWEPVKIDSTSLSSFPNNYGLMKSQILNLLSSPDTSVSAESGNPGFSKTQAGVKAQEATLNVDDNYIRNNFEAWFGRECETLLNLYFAERTDIGEFTVDSETADKLRSIDEGLVSPEGKVRVDFKSATQKLYIKVDAGSSEQQDDTEEIAQLKEVLADYNANPASAQAIQETGKQLSIGEVYKQLFIKLGLKNIDKILTDIPKDENGQPQIAPPQPDANKVSLNYNDLDPTAKAAYLQSLNIPADPNQIAQYEAQKAQMDAPAAPDPNALENHPIIKLMSSLNIKFTDLPEDSKHEVLNIIGIPSQMATPVQTDHSLKAIQTAHTINEGAQSQLQQQEQMAQSQQQNEAQNALTAQGQQQQADAAQAKAANTPEVETPSEQQSEPATAETDEAHLKQLLDMGMSQQQAEQALALIDTGKYSMDEVLQMLGIGVPA